MPGSLHVVPARAATQTLREVIVQQRGDDPLAALTVVVPSALAGATLRRGLFPGGLAGIRFTSLPQLIDGVLTAAGMSSHRRTGARRRALVAQALTGSPWAAAARATETLRLFDALFTEVDEAEVDDVDLGAVDITAVHRAYRALLTDEERIAPADRAAALLPCSGEPVVLHLPRRLAPAELRFCHALGDRLDVIVGLAGDADDDAEKLLEQLQSFMTQDSTTPLPVPAPSVEVNADIDAEEEVRQVVRQVLEHLTDPNHRVDRVAIGYRSAVPYARLIREQVMAVGLPHHVPRQRTLAQGIAGSALLGLLALPDSDFSRPELVHWWGSAPVLGSDGRRISATRWDRLTRQAGVTRGRSVWTKRLTDALDRARDELDQAADDAGDRPRQRVEQLTSLQADVAALFERHDRHLEAGSWSECAAAVLSSLDAHLGGVKEVSRWQPRTAAGIETSLTFEQGAYDSVRQVLGTLAELDDAQPFPGLADFRQVLEAELARPLRESQGLGRGLLIAPIGDLVGADLDLLFVVGMVEGSFPPRAREHPILRDAARVRSNGKLRTTAHRRQAERRDFLLALTSASRVVLSFPAADTRSRRANHPAPWLLEHCSQPPAPRSFTQRALEAAPPLSPGEYDLQLLLAGGRARTDHPLAQAISALSIGLAAVQARSDMVFGPWTGRVDPVGVASVASASGLQKYANCPHSYFLDKVLKVRQVDEPDEEASPLDVGLVVHGALENFFRQHLGRHPDLAWTPAEHAHAHDLLERRARALADEGKAGRPLVWQTRLRQMHRSLRRTLLADDVWRREHRAVPRQVELGFGLEDATQPALEMVLPSGRTVTVRGSIDRLDEHEDGSLTVLDWKTGKSDKFDGLKKEPLDLVDHGRHLQLPLYAKAALEWHGQTAPVQAYYVLVDHGAQRRGGPVDTAQLDRLNDALETLTAGVTGGVFPMNPGEEGYFGWTRCGFCAFERLCPSSRGEQWESVRGHDSLVDYLRLTAPEEPEA